MRIDDTTPRHTLTGNWRFVLHDPREDGPDVSRLLPIDATPWEILSALHDIGIEGVNIDSRQLAGQVSAKDLPPIVRPPHDYGSMFEGATAPDKPDTEPNV